MNDKLTAAQEAQMLRLHADLQDKYWTIAKEGHDWPQFLRDEAARREAAADAPPPPADDIMGLVEKLDAVRYQHDHEEGPSLGDVQRIKKELTAAIEALRAERDAALTTVKAQAAQYASLEARLKLTEAEKEFQRNYANEQAARVAALEGALKEAVEFASQDCQALTPVGEAMVNRWSAIAVGGGNG